MLTWTRPHSTTREPQSSKSNLVAARNEPTNRVNLYETGKVVHAEDIVHSPVTISLPRSSHKHRQTNNEQREPRRRVPCSNDDRLLHTRALRASTRQQFEAMIAQAAGQEYTFLAKASTLAAYPSTTQTMCRSRCRGSLLAHCRAVLRRLSFLATQSR